MSSKRREFLSEMAANDVYCRVPCSPEEQAEFAAQRKNGEILPQDVFVHNETFVRIEKPDLGESEMIQLLLCRQNRNIRLIKNFTVFFVVVMALVLALVAFVIFRILFPLSMLY